MPRSYGYELKKSNAISQHFDDLSSDSSERNERVSNKNIAIITTNTPFISSRDFKKHLNTDENSQYYDLYDILE